ncbi:MAG: biotin carboxylase N-terminal domain-containing protein [bacterium]
MIEKLLVANRGSAALRIIRTCRELGIKTVAVYSETDRYSLPVLLADEAVCIGKSDPWDSYLNISRLLSAAEITRCNAVHPGWSFLAANPEFADAAQNSGLIWIGPHPDLLRLFHSRLAVRARISAADVPVIPAIDEPLKNPEDAIPVCQRLGLPVVVRPVAEYIHRSRIISKEKDIENQVRMCQAEVMAEFETAMSGWIGSSGVYIEKMIPDARHLEIQIGIDAGGQILILNDWEIIEHHGKKLIALSPPPKVKPPRRRQLYRWAEKVARVLNWTGVGTVHFLLDKNDGAYFYRFLPHITEFHPTTEIRSGTDLIQIQLLTALPPPPEAKALLNIPINPISDYIITGQIFAENPDADFEPSLGTITNLRLPGGPNIRLDTDIIPGIQITPFYDYALGTISAWGSEVSVTINRLQRALTETLITGIQTNIPLLVDFARNIGW